MLHKHITELDEVSKYYPTFFTQHIFEIEVENEMNFRTMWTIFHAVFVLAIPFVYGWINVCVVL